MRFHRPDRPPPAAWSRPHRAPWARSAHGTRSPRAGWDGGGPGAVIGALCFHVFGNRAEVAALDRPADLIAGALLLVGPLALIHRRKAPAAVLAVAGAASIGLATLLPPTWTYAVAPVIALFGAVKAGRDRAAATVAAALYAAYLAVTVFFAEPLGVSESVRPGPRIAILVGIALGLVMFLGGSARSRAAYRAEQAKVHAEREAARKEQARRQAADERLRIARELHDVLGHHLSLINVQAGVGLHLMDERPEQARAALSAIKTASSEALREVRAVLGALRPEEEAAPRQPALGLDRLDDLTADAGLPVTTRTTGVPRPLPPEVDRAAYRIVQEALTNVRRHATSGSAEITIEFAPTALHLRIRNDGAAASEPDDTGSGIAGMRARAASLGGTLEAGPVPPGGYLVTAALPTTTEGDT
ncbi:sensor histidine kinase [Actinoplanes sp. NPDC051859]|uniref:sensor histidine kinase n=1 Tax=Actinoplanes sp. NPDC051859 TaxID=3363909 RepID=UPI0037AAF92C